MVKHNILSQNVFPKPNGGRGEKHQALLLLT